MRTVIGIDGGTEGLRAGVFDLSGAPLAFASHPYATAFPRAGWAEQDPEDWWTALGAAVRAAVAEAGVRPDQVDALALDTTSCSVVVLGTDHRPLRPALIWMDVRAAAETEAVLATGDSALILNSGGDGPVSAEWMLPKVLWLKRHEPDTIARAGTVCEYQDYLNLRLTGRKAASITNASIRWHYRARDGGYARSLVDALGLPELIDLWPGEVLPVGDVVGGLTAEAAGHLGLPAGTPVAQGGPDAFIATLGLGVARPGSLALITGSSHLQLGLSDTPVHGRGIWGSYADAVVPGLHVIEGGQTSTGSVIAWLRRLFGDAVDYEALNAEAAALPPGADGVLVQEHFQGNRTPYTDPLSRGVIAGLSLSHGRGHLFRAAIEGIAFGTELIFETMRAAGCGPARVVIAGGATRSPLWLQIHADVSGLPMVLTKVPDAPSLGSAVIAATAAGHYSDLPAAAEAMVRIDRTVEPDPATHAVYRDLFQRYKALYPATAPIHRAGTDTPKG